MLGEIVHPETKKILNEELIKDGYAVKYRGENKDKIQNQHKINRKRLIDEGIVKMSYKDRVFNIFLYIYNCGERP